MVPSQQLTALKRSARNDFLASRYRLVAAGADRLPGHKFYQAIEALDDLPPQFVRDGPIGQLFLGVDLGPETYGETVEASVVIGLVTCRGAGNRRHAISGLTLFQATLVHEIGHTVAFADGRRLQQEFESAFWRGSRCDRTRGSPVTQYACIYPSEDFAEAFLHYRHNATWMADVSTERYAWMREHVFAGREFGRPSAGAERGLPPIHRAPLA